MKSKIITAVITSLTLLMGSSWALADTYVKGYYKKDGTYVAPHYRSSPNSTKSDNWSTKGNVNPYTGKPGTKDPYSSPYSQPSYSNQYGNQ